MRSIHRHLLITLLSILLFSFSISGVLGYLSTKHEVQELFDAQLIENARVLKGVMNHPTQSIDWNHMRASLEETSQENPAEDDLMAAGHDYEKKISIQVWSETGDLVLRSPSAPEYSLAPLHHGFYTRKSKRHVWHVFVTSLPENKHWLIVAERSDVREELSRNIAGSLLLGSLIGLGFAFFLVRRNLKTELKPLVDLRNTIDTHNPDKLAPISLSDQREELEPVVSALNHLLNKVASGIEREKHFLADAAHELRTPLAVMKLQAQNALAAKTISDKHLQLERLISGVDRSTRVVEQMLLLARLDADAIPVLPEPVAFDELARDTLASLTPLAMTRHQELALEIEKSDKEGKIFITAGNAVLLGAMLRNLVENAMRHSDVNSEILVLLSSEEKNLKIRIQDKGPGVDDAILSDLTLRFIRGNSSGHISSGDTMGSGLGLAIAMHIAELHKGTLRLRNLQPHGLEVCVSLPQH